MKITAIIPTLNEEIHIEEAIKSVGFADEIIVIDSYSTDRTVELAKKYDVKVILREFDDFSTQKNFAIDQASHDWIYILDADERVTFELKEEILEAVKNSEENVGFNIRRTFYFLGKKINYSGWQRDKVVRLFLKEYCRYDGKLVHETIKANGKLGFLKNKIDHFSFRGYDHYISKLNQYSWLQAKQLHAKGKKASLYHILIKPPIRFIIHYIVKLGFLDGFEGIVIAKIQSYGVLSRYLKLRLLRRGVTEENDTGEAIKSDFPVDAVFTWVDGNDPSHRAKMNEYLEDKGSINSKAVRTRYDQVNEIEFAVRSILKYAKFIRTIFIVTDNQTPDFLKDAEKAKKEYPNVKIIDHKEIFKGYEEYLPTFNCRPIETELYKIPGLAEHYVYFNDDLFLLKETSREDFFKDGFPILRGKWSKFNEDIFIKRFKKLITNKAKAKKAGHKIAQQKGAKISGFKRYFKHDHTPHTFRKSTLENFFKEHKEIETTNVKYRFRHSDQFTPQSLANHIEIKNNTCSLSNDYNMIYFQNYKKPFWWLKLKLLRFSKKPDKLFLCMQSLDQCPEEKFSFIKKWLLNKYF